MNSKPIKTKFKMISKSNSKISLKSVQNSNLKRMQRLRCSTRTVTLANMEKEIRSWQKSRNIWNFSKTKRLARPNRSFKSKKSNCVKKSRKSSKNWNKTCIPKDQGWEDQWLERAMTTWIHHLHRLSLLVKRLYVRHQSIHHLIRTCYIIISNNHLN